jgi:hypothetical protein
MSGDTCCLPSLFVVRTTSFRLLYGLVILRHAAETAGHDRYLQQPTAQWIAGQVTEAFPWDGAPRHLIRDRDGAFGPTTPGAFVCWASATTESQRIRLGGTDNWSG